MQEQLTANWPADEHPLASSPVCRKWSAQIRNWFGGEGLRLEKKPSQSHCAGSSPLFAASESAALKATKKERERPSQHEEIIKLLRSVGAKKGPSSKVHLSSTASVESTSHTYSTHYNAASFRKINTSYYRQVHDDIWKVLRTETESVNPKKAVELMKKMKGQEEYRRRCGSRVLCLDGGGIRGLLQMATLREIERQTGMKIVELFDWIVGTSTGGIIALSLTYGDLRGGG